MNICEDTSIFPRTTKIGEKWPGGWNAKGLTAIYSNTGFDGHTTKNSTILLDEHRGYSQEQPGEGRIKDTNSSLLSFTH